MNNFVDKLTDVIMWIVEKIAILARVCWEWFINISWPNKIVFLTGFLAVYTIITPAARFFIFGGWNYVNNPMSVYLIGIALVMFGSIFINNLVITIIKIGLNLIYIISTLYLLLADKITSANRFEICGEYYLNFAVPGIYILCAVLSYFVFPDYD